MPWKECFFQVGAEARRHAAVKGERVTAERSGVFLLKNGDQGEKSKQGNQLLDLGFGIFFLT